MKPRTSMEQAAFCIDCGSELEDFCFSPEAKNLDALRAAALRCQLQGNQKGKVCAKVFIAGEHQLSPMFAGRAGKRPSKRFLQDLKNAILELIREDRT